MAFSGLLATQWSGGNQPAEDVCCSASHCGCVTVSLFVTRATGAICYYGYELLLDKVSSEQETGKKEKRELMFTFYLDPLAQFTNS